MCTFEMSFEGEEIGQDEEAELFWFMNKVVPHAKKNTNKTSSSSYFSRVTASDEAFACMMLDTTRERVMKPAPTQKTRTPMSGEAKAKSQARYSEVLKKFTQMRKEYADNYETVKDWMRSHMIQEGEVKQTTDEESDKDKFGWEEATMTLEENPHVMMEL